MGRVASNLPRRLPLAALLAGCAVGPDYAAPHVRAAVELGKRAGRGAPLAAAALDAWWRAFADPTLDQLDRARRSRGTPTSPRAKAKIREARATRREAAAALAPSLHRQRYGRPRRAARRAPPTKLDAARSTRPLLAVRGRARRELGARPVRRQEPRSRSGGLRRAGGGGGSRRGSADAGRRRRRYYAEARGYQARIALARARWRRNADRRTDACEVRRRLRLRRRRRKGRRRRRRAPRRTFQPTRLTTPKRRIVCRC